MTKLENKKAIITGASKGIGAAIAKRLAAEGASVIVNYSSDKAGADRTVAEITKLGGKAVAVQANLAEPAGAKKLADEAKKVFGTLDILVNNAGVYEFLPLEAITPEHFHKQFNLNVLGLLLVTQEASKLFGDKGGSVVNISSVVSSLALPGSSVYAATKASVDLITSVLSVELAPKKIRVNAVNPGMIETEGVKTAGFDQGDFRAHYESTNPLGRIGQPDEIAAAVAFLVSNDASYVTGETLRVSGGAR
jgi:3-oxoacyl-[acyl-carrier protein] reductase